MPSVIISLRESHLIRCSSWWQRGSNTSHPGPPQEQTRTRLAQGLRAGPKPLFTIRPECQLTPSHPLPVMLSIIPCASRPTEAWSTPQAWRPVRNPLCQPAYRSLEHTAGLGRAWKCHFSPYSLFLLLPCPSPSLLFFLFLSSLSLHTLSLSLTRSLSVVSPLFSLFLTHTLIHKS